MTKTKTGSSDKNIDKQMADKDKKAAQRSKALSTKSAGTCGHSCAKQRKGRG